LLITRYAGWPRSSRRIEGELVRSPRATFFIVQTDCPDNDRPEPGYFSPNELEEINGFLGLLIERDLYFEPQPLSKRGPGLFLP